MSYENVMPPSLALSELSYLNEKLYFALADYCDSRGMTQEQFEAAAAHVIGNEDATILVQTLLAEAGGWSPTGAEAKKSKVEIERDEIRDLYKRLIGQGDKNKTQILAQLEEEFDCSNSKVKAAVRGLPSKADIKADYRKNWIWWDYYPTLDEQVGNKAATYRELAARHGVSESTVKRLLKPLLDGEYTMSRDHDWVPPNNGLESPKPKDRGKGFVWAGRVGHLVRDFKAAKKELGKAKAISLVSKRYGFREDQVKELLRRFPRELVHAELTELSDSGCTEAEATAKLCHKYSVTKRELNKLLSDIE